MVTFFGFVCDRVSSKPVCLQTSYIIKDDFEFLLMCGGCDIVYTHMNMQVCIFVLVQAEAIGGCLGSFSVVSLKPVGAGDFHSKCPYPLNHTLDLEPLIPLLGKPM